MMNRSIVRGIQYSSKNSNILKSLNNTSIRSIVANNPSSFTQQRSFTSINHSIFKNNNSSILFNNNNNSLNSLQLANKRFSTQPPKEEKKVEESKQQTEQQTEQPADLQPEDVMPKNLSTPEKIKYLFKRYGVLAVIVHFSIYGATLGSLYLALSNGVDVEQIFTYFGIEQTKMGKGLGVFALAFALTKLTGFIRVPLTIILVPILSRYIRRAKLTK